MSHDLQKSLQYADLQLKKLQIIINVENSFAAQYFSGNRDTFYFQDSLMNKKLKRAAFI